VRAETVWNNAAPSSYPPVMPVTAKSLDSGL